MQSLTKWYQLCLYFSLIPQIFAWIKERSTLYFFDFRVHLLHRLLYVDFVLDLDDTDFFVEGGYLSLGLFEPRWGGGVENSELYKRDKLRVGVYFIQSPSVSYGPWDTLSFFSPPALSSWLETVGQFERHQFHCAIHCFRVSFCSSHGLRCYLTAFRTPTFQACWGSSFPAEWRSSWTSWRTSTSGCSLQSTPPCGMSSGSLPANSTPGCARTNGSPQCLFSIVPPAGNASGPLRDSSKSTLSQ